MTRPIFLYLTNDLFIWDMMVYWYDHGYRAGDFIPVIAGGLNELELNEMKTSDYEKY